MVARPQLTNGFTIKQKTGCGSMYITINDDESGKLKEIFCNIGKGGTCAKTWAEAVGRLLGEGIKKEVDIKRMIKTLKGIRCGNATDELVSCPDAIAKSLEYYLTTKEKKQEVKIEEVPVER